MSELLEAILQKLPRGDCPDTEWPDRKGEYRPPCPYVSHTYRSFAVSERGWYCFSCQKGGGLRALAEHLGVSVAVLHPSRRDTAPLPPTFENYAEMKHLPPEFLETLGMQTIHIGGKPALKVPYYDLEGVERSVRFRISLTGTDRFRWRKGSKVMPYGLWRLPEMRKAGWVLLVEGESDAHTAWYHSIPAIGIPGANTWRDSWVEYLEGLDVCLWREPDEGGSVFMAAVEVSAIVSNHHRPRGTQGPERVPYLGR